MTEEKSSYLTTLEKEYQDFRALYESYRDNLVDRLQHWWGEHVGDLRGLSPEAFLDTFSSIVDGLYTNLQGSDLEVLHEEEDEHSGKGSFFDVESEFFQLKTMLSSLYGNEILKRLHLEGGHHTKETGLLKELEEAIHLIEEAQRKGESVLPEQVEPWKPTWRQESLLARLQQLRSSLPQGEEEQSALREKSKKRKRFQESLALAREVHAQLARLSGDEDLAAMLRNFHLLTAKDAAEQAEHRSHPAPQKKKPAEKE